MDSRHIHEHIDDLVAEEPALLEQGGHEEGLGEAGHERPEAIKVELDRYWDLLCQRLALAESGLDPDVARLRTADTVEGYLQ
jgi:Protein of unknown function (DUF2630)